MTRRLLATIVAIGSFVPIGASAATPSNCADRQKVLERLDTAFGETRQSVGLGTNNSMMEIFASEETGTWTITVTLPTGKTCLIASGKAFENLPQQKVKGKGV